MSKAGVFLASVGLSLCTVMADNLPDAELNPQSNRIEVVGSVSLFGDHEVRHVVTGSEPTVSILTSNSIDDYSPRIAVSPGGDTFVVWWSDESTDTVRVRRLDYTTGAWGPEVILSDPGEGSRSPEIVHDGSNTYVAFEHDSVGVSGIKVGAISDEPEPFGLFVTVAETEYAGDLEVQLQAEQGALWMTWIDSASDVGWCVLDVGTETWSQPQYESYAADDVASARERIREGVLGG